MTNKMISLFCGLLMYVVTTVPLVWAAEAPTSLGVMVEQPAHPESNGDIGNTGTTQQDGSCRFALTLAGGGARGAAHVGVLKVLEREGLKPSFVSGSSIGAVVGSLYCAGVSVAQIEKLMLNEELRKAFMPRPMLLQASLFFPQYVLLRMVNIQPYIGLYSGKSIEKFIHKQLPPSISRIEDLKIPFAVIATNIQDTRSFWLCKGDIARAVRASASIPFVYKPVNIDGNFLVDGGIRDNLPTDPARACGAPVVVAVRLHSSLKSKPAETFRTMRSYSDRIMSMLMAEIEAKNTSGADIVIEPEIEDLQLYAFDRRSLAQAMSAGEAAAEKMLPRLKAILQAKEKTANSYRQTD